MGFLTGKKLLITGVLSNAPSPTASPGPAMRRAPAGLQLRGQALQGPITEFAAEFNSTLVFDAATWPTTRADRGGHVQGLGRSLGPFDGFMHSIGFAPREAIA